MRRPSNSSSADAKTVEAAAVRLLARREHSIEELRRKLLSKGYPPDTIEPVVQKLAGKRLVSDERFTSSFVHHHAKRGQGPVRIRAELRQQGIADPQVEEALRSADIDWVQLAREVRRRKFGATAPRSLGERAKQARFLQYRGFDAEQLHAAFREESGEAEGAPDITPDII
ncbi:MAG TPA: regulatory protein RecX [Burkholderiales bacterium]|nr:regulatory protein RecX [Burkholderiales bacterium]